MKYAIGIDMGGTKIKGAIIDEKNHVHNTEIMPTEANLGKTRIVFNLVKVIKNLKEKFNGHLEGVGISMPGFIDDIGNVALGGGTLDCLEGIKLKKVLEKKIGLSVFIDNDANCFALAEAIFGAGKKSQIMLGVIWGTGIGGGIIINKKIMHGAVGGAGEFGHMIIDTSIKTGPKCGCGNRGCLEMLSSGKNIVRMYIAQGGKLQINHVGDIFNSKEKIAKDVIKSAIHYLGLGLANLVQMINPDMIVLGGGVSLLPDKAYRMLQKEVKKYAHPSLTKNLKIVRHKISDDAGMYGAANLVFNNNNT